MGDKNIKMPNEFSTNLISKIDRVKGVTSFRFERPEDLRYQAGQFFILTIFPGQEREMTKHFSFSSSPTEDFIEFTTRMTGSDFKNRLSGLKKGDEVIIKAPYGQFVLNQENKLAAFLIGGIGITPVRSISKYCTDTGSDTDIIILYGNDNNKQITFLEDFNRMSEANPKLNLVNVITKPDQDWSGYTGYIDKDIIKKEINDYLKRDYYISGPPKMVNAMRDIIESLKISSEQLHQESFTGYE